MPGKRLVLFGAGMTGRGQVAQLAYEDGWELTLIDANAELVRRLREAGQYTVRLLSDHPRELIISGWEVLHTSETEAIGAAVGAADFVLTSVLEPNLPAVAEVLAPALARRLATYRAPLNVVAAENMMNSSEVLAGYVRALWPAGAPSLEGVIGFPNSMIARVVPIASDPLLIVAEEFSEWTADAHAAVGEAPALRGLEWVDNQTARLQRKLYIHNTGHAVCGYFGWLAGYTYIHEAAGDPRIMARIRAAIAESGEAISREHGFSRESVRAYEENLTGRLVLSALPDDIRRVIRQPLRKLGGDERLLGPLQLCEKHGVPTEGLSWGIAAALASRMSGEEQFERMAEAVDRLGPGAALGELVGWTPSATAGAQIAAAYEALKS
ncbi:MAG TPA: hypothetical protein VGM19_11915 [Armatimonadota bacterium]|jgi:mannitol-1-phosphate 5-dehydrogenase